MPSTAKLEKKSKDSEKKASSNPDDEKRTLKRHSFKKKTNLRSQFSDMIRSRFSESGISLKIEKKALDYLQFITEVYINDAIEYMNKTKKKPNNMIGRKNLEVYTASHFPHIKTQLNWKVKKTLDLFNSSTTSDSKKGSEKN